MTVFRLLSSNLRHHWQTNIAVVLAVVAGTAVITGALVVGDSVRGSLYQMTLDRLGKVDDVLTAPSFFDQERAQTLSAQPDFQSRFSAVAPALMLPGTFTAEHAKRTRRAGKVQLIGLDCGAFWNMGTSRFRPDRTSSSMHGSHMSWEWRPAMTSVCGSSLLRQSPRNRS
jgi:hypothetical protein